MMVTFKVVTYFIIVYNYILNYSVILSSSTFITLDFSLAFSKFDYIFYILPMTLYLINLYMKRFNSTEF